MNKYVLMYSYARFARYVHNNASYGLSYEDMYLEWENKQSELVSGETCTKECKYQPPKNRDYRHCYDCIDGSNFLTR